MSISVHMFPFTAHWRSHRNRDELVVTVTALFSSDVQDPKTTHGQHQLLQKESLVLVNYNPALVLTD